MTTFARQSLRLLLCLAVGLALQLHAATASDIQGEWVIDGTATWEAMKSAPEIAAMPPEQQKMLETMMIGQMSAMSTVVTADTITQSTPDGKTKTNPYKVTKVEGDTVTTEYANDQGMTVITHCLVKGDTISMTSPQQAGMTIVMKRKAAK